MDEIKIRLLERREKIKRAQSEAFERGNEHRLDFVNGRMAEIDFILTEYSGMTLEDLERG